MRSPIVHIGFHKTATSWFQTSVYPKVTSHRLIDRDLVRGTFMDCDAFDFDPVGARDRLELDATLLPPLICEEELSGILHIGAASTYIAKEVAHRLHATMPDARIIIVVRSQLDAAASWYMQYLKEGGTASARRYFFPDEYIYPGRLMLFKTARFDFSQLDYSGLIKAYDELFGRDKVHVFAFEDLSRDGLRVVAEMQQRIGFTLRLEEVSTARVNTSYQRGLIPIARALNLFSGRSVANKRTILHLPYWYRTRKFILERLNAIPIFGRAPTAPELIDHTTVTWIRHRFAASNRWLAERMNRDLAELGYWLTPLKEPAPAPTRSRLLRWTRK